MTAPVVAGPTAEQLAGTVLIGAFDPILEDWTSALGCVAWVDKSDRRCGKDAPGYLCTRHETVARRRWDAEVAKAEAHREKILARRSEKLPAWREELARVEAEIARLDPPRPVDRAAYTGNAHPSIDRRRRAFMSDRRISTMANLWRRHEELTRLIGTAA